MSSSDRSRDPIYLGLMSGTSLDAIDGALVRWTPEGPDTLAFTSQAFEPALRAELLALQAPGQDELHRAALAAVGLSRAYAEVCAELMRHMPHRSAVAAIGAHGQTVRHRPDADYTLQLLSLIHISEPTRPY